MTPDQFIFEAKEGLKAAQRHGTLQVSVYAAGKLPLALEIIERQGKALNTALEECKRLKSALEFYAGGNHFEECNDEECDKYADPETVSGEPENFVCGHGDYTVEDGSIAQAALKGGV